VAEHLEQLVVFARRLRAAGLLVGTGAVDDYCRAAALVGPAGLYWAGRATLVTRREEIPIYDRIFRGFYGVEASPPPHASRAQELAALRPVDVRDADARSDDVDPPAGALASRIEILRHKRFDRCTREELDELATLASGFARSLPDRRARRRRPADAGALDVPRTLRRALRTGGEPFDRRFRYRSHVARKLVLLLDVSNSMSAYSRGPLVLAHALLRVRPHTEVFCFGTRLTSTTRALAVRDPDEALARAAEEVFDWDGGTRIGDSLKAFLDNVGHRGTARGAIVLICSDGLDVGDPEVLRAQMERLDRLAYRILWLNPLKEHPAYEPLARGMAAALPYVDVFASGHNLASLEEAAGRLARRRPIYAGYSS
jgi:uncharacterized protein with von Willebrand factor type A (vWA) domain